MASGWRASWQRASYCSPSQASERTGDTGACLYVNRLRSPNHRLQATAGGEAQLKTGSELARLEEDDAPIRSLKASGPSRPGHTRATGGNGLTRAREIGHGIR